MVLVALEVGLAAEKPGEEDKFVLKQNKPCSLFHLKSNKIDKKSKILKIILLFKERFLTLKSPRKTPQLSEGISTFSSEIQT